MYTRDSKDALDQPLYAPKFPGTAGAKANWDGLLEHVIELHNDGKINGFVSFGARKEWPRAPQVFPTLRMIRDANMASLKRDSEVKLLLQEALVVGGTSRRAASGETSDA